MKPILILAGGFGTRLKSVVSEVPKPLAPVAGKPFLVHLIDNLIIQGANEFLLLLFYKAEAINNVINQYFSEKNGIKIKSIIEKTPLGTGGSILNAIHKLNITESFIVINADTWLECGLDEINCSPKNSIATIKVQDCSRYGTLKLNNKKVENFIEKDDFTNGGYINAGMYHLDPKVFLQFKLNSNFSIENDIFPSLSNKGILSAVKIDTKFIDIGIPEDYFKFCAWMESEKINDL